MLLQILDLAKGIRTFYIASFSHIACRHTSDNTNRRAFQQHSALWLLLQSLSELDYFQDLDWDNHIFYTPYSLRIGDLHTEDNANLLVSCLRWVLAQLALELRIDDIAHFWNTDDLHRQGRTNLLASAFSLSPFQLGGFLDFHLV